MSEQFYAPQHVGLLHVASNYNHQDEDAVQKDASFSKSELQWLKSLLNAVDLGDDITDIFSSLSDEVIDAFFKRADMLEGLRGDLLKEITELSAKIELLTQVQAFISNTMNGMGDKDKVNLSDSVITITKEQWESSPGLKDYLEKEYGLNLDGKDSVDMKIKDIFSEELPVDIGLNNLSLNDLNRLSSDISNQIKILNDETSQKMTRYQDYSSKYDATIDAISKFLDKYFQALMGIQRNTQ